MKKILILILVLSLSLSVMVGCDKLTELVPGLENILPGAHQHNYVDGVCECGEKDPTYVAPHEHNFVEGKCECGEEDPNYVPPVEEDADLKAAYDYVHQNTKTIAEKTGANYKVILNAPVGSKNYAVVWEIIGTDEVVIEGDTVVVPEPTADINYTLKFTVTNEKGETLSREYSHIVPKFKYNTFAEYAAAEDEAPLVICGIVSGVFSKTTGSSANGLYIQDLNNEGGYYVYNLTDDPNGVILPGMTVKVKGNKDLYNGTYELIDAEVVVIDETIKAIEPIDYTELLLGAAALNDAALVEKQGMLVTVKGVTLLEAGDNGYYYFQAGNHKVYLRISSSNNATTKEALETIKSIHGANYGNLADITGVISLYNGNFYLSPVSADMISNVKVPERSDAEKIALELDALSLPTSISTDTVVELPLVGSSYDNVVITWTIDNADFTISEDGKLSIALGSSAVTLKLTATLTCGEATDSKEFTIDVSASLVMNESLAYVPYINQVNNGTVLYLDGGVSGRYLTTTTDASKAAAVYAEKAEGGYKFYILGDDGAKLYINIYKNADNKDSVNYDAAGETVFTYNKTVNAFVTNLEGVDVYLGIYNTFDTFKCPLAIIFISSQEMHVHTSNVRAIFVNNFKRRNTVF